MEPLTDESAASFLAMIERLVRDSRDKRVTDRIGVALVANGNNPLAAIVLTGENCAVMAAAVHASLCQAIGEGPDGVTFTDPDDRRDLVGEGIGKAGKVRP